MSVETADAGHRPMTQTADTQTPTAPAWLRIALIVIAAIEVFDAIVTVSILFDDIPGVSDSGAMSWSLTSRIALESLLAVTALVLAFRRRLAGAIVALAAIVALQWFAFLPTHINHWATYEGEGLWSVRNVFDLAGYPLLALAAAVLAWLNTRLGLATLMVAIPIVIDIASILAFTAGVTIYGF